MGSSPIRVVLHGILAQLGEHLPYKQRVIGSSPIGPTNADIAQFVAIEERSESIVGRAADYKSAVNSCRCGSIGRAADL